MIILFIAFMLVGWAVQSKLKSKFKHYGAIPLANGMSGKQVAEKMLADHNITNVRVISTPGKLTDHYNPKDMTVNLSPEVYEGKSISAAAVSAHECGHAVQHATAYKWLQMRSQMVPIVGVSSKMLNFIFLAGMFGMGVLHMFTMDMVILAVIFFQAMITIFSVITLPVEYDASYRAVVWLEHAGVVQADELEGANDALKWAARTYLVSAIAAVTYLAYYVMMYLGGRD
ncbi:MAG: zinc metallopeptidase [Flavobacteriales bacterium]|jgi:Zn-dependent membrane protease YugP|tara:strand:- start:1971 stop:2657 length:687 start_codon:yes stop_codon:yes gene_type:complete